MRRGDLDKTEHAMNSLIASVVWDEARFGLPLDLERFMIVAVERLQHGRDGEQGPEHLQHQVRAGQPATATDDDFVGIESVVGHEYFHNWTGNRITCRDWFQLSLKEGLTVFRDQEFSMDMAGAASARAVKRIEDVRTLRDRAVPRGRRHAWPTRCGPTPTSRSTTSTPPTVYEKGAEVVRMMHTLVGRDGFASGMALYFERHDGQAVTCDDFAQAIADANPGSALAAQLRQFKRWYAQAGTPRAHGARPLRRADAHATRCGSSSTRLARPGGEAADVIPVAMGLFGARRPAAAAAAGGRAAAARRAPNACWCWTEAERSFYTFVDVDERAGAVAAARLLGAGDAGRRPGDADLLVLLAHDTDPFNRWEAGQRLALRRLLAALQRRHRCRRSTRPSSRRCAACCATRSSTRPSRRWC